MEQDRMGHARYVKHGELAQLTPYLWIGGGYDADRPDSLAELGIDTLINLSMDSKYDVYGDQRFDPANTETMIYHFRMQDRAAIDEIHLDTFIALMLQVYREKRKAFMHCAGGVSRTGAFAVAWLMFQAGACKNTNNKEVYHAALRIVQTVRPCIDPHPVLEQSVIDFFNGITRNYAGR